MPGIAGIAQTGRTTTVRRMLEKMAHRGQDIEIIETEAVTLGVIYPPHQAQAAENLKQTHLAMDAAGPGHFASARGDSLLLKRDLVGVVPLYYGNTPQCKTCFASEVKGLIEVTDQVHELPPGHTFDGHKREAYAKIGKLPLLEDSPQEITYELRRRLEASV